MSENKATRKDLFVRIAERMADDPEVVEMCGKYIEQLSRPRKKKVNEASLAIADEVMRHLREVDGPQTNKDLYLWYNENAATADGQISSQKMAAVMRYLVGQQDVIKIVGDKASDPAMFKIA